MPDHKSIWSAAVTLAIICGLIFPGAAPADGDPASDTLYTQNVFLPYSTKVTPALAHELEQATAAAAQHAGRQVRVALIAAPSDLGAVPSLYGRPAAYARFLGMELQFVYPGRLLVVMPQGAALSQKGRFVPTAMVDNAKVGPGADGLASTAVRLVRALTGPPKQAPPKDQVRPAPTVAPRSDLRPGAAPPKPHGVPVWEATAIAVTAVSALLLVGLAVVRRWGHRNRLQPLGPVAVRSPDPDDPYRYTGPL
jgi:hypothetical protein